MADALVTQVARNGAPVAVAKPAPQRPPPPPRRSFLASLFCCCSKGDSRPPPSADQWNSLDPGYNLLPRKSKKDNGKKCLVLDLDETLVHSSFKPVPNADFVVPIEIDGTVHNVFVLKRPFVDEFLAAVGPLFEIVLFTASLSKYADPVSDQLDKGRVFRHRLFREHCVYHRGNYVKDLARLGRDIGDCIIVDNSPASYMFHPENAVPCLSWFEDENDTVLKDMIPFMRELAEAKDIYPLLR